MFFVAPLMELLLIYLAAAVLPAVILLIYVYRQDRTEPEPPDLLLSLVLLGVAAALLSLLPEALGESVLSALVQQNSAQYVFLLAFLVVAVVEEGAKFLLLYRRTWHEPNFNFRFDGIVYAVSVSLGFAALENIKYVFTYGLSVAAPRALLSIPGHMSFAVFMGLFYGRARLYADRGENGRAKLALFAGWLAAVLLHGVYDSCAMTGTTESTIFFLVFAAVLYFIVFRLIRKEARSDRPV